MITQNSIYKFVGALAVSAALTSCTDNFDELNSNPNGITDREVNATVDVNDLILTNLKSGQRNIYVFNPSWQYQVQQNLNADIYSGYMMSPNPYQGNTNNMTYALVAGWNETAFNVGYDNAMKPLTVVEDSTRNKADRRDTHAMAKILKVEAMHRISDIYGPIIYTKYMKPNPDGSVDYDTQETAYTAFFEDLKTAIEILTDLSGQQPSTAFASADLVYGGDYSKWLKFANTLRLRLAIRISNVAPEKAKAEGEAALANSGGLLDSNADNFLVDIETAVHPLNVINNDWGDLRIGAPLGAIMTGYNDPRLPYYALPASDDVVEGQYIGIRQGINIDEKARYADYSKLVTFGNKIQLMVAAEAWFLKAEAALKSWAGAGIAGDNYEKAIQRSFEQYGVTGSLATYLADDEHSSSEYIDPKAVTEDQNDIKAGDPNLSTVTIKWEEGASAEVKLERIITQKWIAMYPEGQEAWSEFRRTGYPRLYPVIVNNSGGKITGFIKRLGFAQSEYSTNKFALDRIISTMGGPDTGGTPLWWDVD
ncbi:SusD/RagB family nutrient-binding outer membrane lipoprotein [Fulvivirgaceae bacterium PWU5]|uniref:SusD/RagB family nutrient-binding outer membrane lipoprotein n=1 Tax=Dawidia cretensis TaxID=2782350 RepID=A0AAP2GR13_9BACT|nr:SusD/RagB family nutrient-binding outer membrane lipoprotein [Dawidia cretensis]MBT1709859.1 SusD/RagB family nutrient-binding outer membrane lipoprotein [Dawidia cretensis]